MYRSKQTPKHEVAQPARGIEVVEQLISRGRVVLNKTSPSWKIVRLAQHCAAIPFR